jgi:predicted TIM-barrel fold metal-dependent hydrolase
MATRRGFLQTAALSAAVAGLTPLYATAAQNLSSQNPLATSRGRKGIIDTHTHWIGPSVIELLKKRTTGPFYTTNAKGELISVPRGTQPTGKERPQSAAWFDIEARLRHLDEASVQRQVLSWTGAAYEGQIAPEEAKPFWKAQNDDTGAVVKRYPSRFSGLATLPTSDPIAAAAELDRAHTELGLSGGTLPLDSLISLDGARALAPIFAVAQKHRSHIYVHRGLSSTTIPGETTEVGATNTYFGLAASQAPNERPKAIAGDDAIARAALITSTHLASGVITLALSDFLDAYPDVTVQIAMIGGSIAFVAEQIQFMEESAGLPDSSQRLRRLYYDTGQFGRGPHNIAHTAKVFGAERILFGSDYGPQASIVPWVEAVERADVTSREKDLIFFDNAKRIFEKS